MLRNKLLSVQEGHKLDFSDDSVHTNNNTSTGSGRIKNS